MKHEALEDEVEELLELDRLVEQEVRAFRMSGAESKVRKKSKRCVTNQFDNLNTSINNKPTGGGLFRFLGPGSGIQACFQVGTQLVEQHPEFSLLVVMPRLVVENFEHIDNRRTPIQGIGQHFCQVQHGFFEDIAQLVDISHK